MSRISLLVKGTGREKEGTVMIVHRRPSEGAEQLLLQVHKAFLDLW